MSPGQICGCAFLGEFWLSITLYTIFNVFDVAFPLLCVYFLLLCLSLASTGRADKEVHLVVVDFLLFLTMVSLCKSTRYFTHREWLSASCAHREVHIGMFIHIEVLLKWPWEQQRTPIHGYI